MEIFFYLIIFIIGTLFGSFYTLAVYRIPKKQDIIHTHSYCPNCNHKLGLLDLIPVFSYIILGGKCRYCKEKIRPRYLILEILSGLIFVLFAYFTKLGIYNLNKITIIDFCFLALYFTFIVLIAGIDKENRKINKSVNIYGILISICYMVYLCIIAKTTIYRYGIYSIFYIIVLILDTITLREYPKSSYINGLVLMVLTMAIFTGEYIAFNSVILTLLAVAIYILFYKLKNRKNKDSKNDNQVAKGISVGFYLGAANILTLIFILAYNYYVL